MMTAHSPETAGAERLPWQPPPATRWQPTPQHQLLLQASFAEAAAAIAAWQTWQQRIDIEHLDEGSYWLLPRLYRRLQGLTLGQQSAEEIATLQRLKGVYRHVWSRNQMILHDLGQAVQQLQQAQIPVVVVGGAALVAAPQADVGSRRADDSGLWVPEASLTEALDRLNALGWQPTQARSPAQLRSQQTAVGLRRHRHTLTLYWRVLPPCPALGVAGEVTQGGTPIQLGAVPAIALAPTEQCFVCCVQATRWQPRSPVYWLADAADLIQRHPIDWPRLVALAQAHRLGLPLRESLALLAPMLNNPGLNTTLQQLHKVSISAFERAEFAAQARPHPLLGQLPPQWFEYRRLSPQPWPQRLWGFAQFLSQRWGLKSPWYIPLHGGKQGLKRLWRLSPVRR